VQGPIVVVGDKLVVQSFFVYRKFKHLILVVGQEVQAGFECLVLFFENKLILFVYIGCIYGILVFVVVLAKIDYGVGSIVYSYSEFVSLVFRVVFCSIGAISNKCRNQQ
jgi:hypothetical protein